MEKTTKDNQELLQEKQQLLQELSIAKQQASLLLFKPLILPLDHFSQASKNQDQAAAEKKALQDECLGLQHKIEEFNQVGRKPHIPPLCCSLRLLLTAVTQPISRF